MSRTFRRRDLDASYPATPDFFGTFSVNERTNENWLDSLGSAGGVDEAALGELRDTLCRGLRRALSGRAAADEGFVEDMAQETVLKVLAGLSSFRGDSKFTTWAITIAVRVAFTELRRARWKEVSLDRLVAESPGVVAAPLVAATPADGARESVLARMQQVLETDLTHRQRQALVAELRGMPQAEIAAQLGLTRNALYKLTYDARQNLKRGLEAAGIGGDEVREAFDL